MRIHVDDIPEDGLRQDLELPVSIQNDAGTDIAQVSIKLLRFGTKVLVEGTIHIQVSSVCSRCLKGFSQPVKTAFRDEFGRFEELDTAVDQELTEGEMDLSFYRDDEINISSMIKEQVILSVPMKPLCSPDCQGICPHCGKDLNEGPCLCKPAEIDPRLAPLRKLKETMKDRQT